MTNFLKKLFFPNWEEIFLATSTYKTYIIVNGVEVVKNPKTTFTCILLFSKVRDKFKIKYSGYIPEDPKGSSAYKKCLDKVTELRNK